MELWATKYLLEHSEPVSVFEWLKDNQRKKRDLLGEDREELENALLIRKEPVINLGLALYGTDAEVGEKLYREGDEPIKRTVLSGSTITPDLFAKSWITKLLPELLAEWNEDHLRELFANSHLPDDVLVDLFTLKTPFNSLDEEKWIILCAYASRNDRLSTPYDDSWMDGWSEYKYGLVFTSAWWLFAKFPQTPLAAAALNQLGEKLVVEKPHDMDVMSVVGKWNTEPDDENAEDFARVRSSLTNLISNYGDEFEALKDSSDLALRQAYYRNLKYPKLDDIEQGFERDANQFIDSALDNQHFFTDASIREALSKACWDAPDEHFDMWFPNIFKSRCRYWESKHPEWFKDDWSGELPFDQIENQNERIEKRIERLNTQVNEIHKVLHGKNDDYAEEPEPAIIDYLRSELGAIAQLLVKIHNKNNATWGWAIAGAAIGYIIARL